jgi:hypothetical protein
LPPQPTKAVPQKAVANEEAEPSTRAFRTGPEGARKARRSRVVASRSAPGDRHADRPVPSVRISCIFRPMNRFGFDLHPQDVRWAAAEGVSEDVIAAVLLLHERPVDEIAPNLSPAELEKVIVLVGRNPRLYPPGIMDALEQRRGVLAPTPSVASTMAAKRDAGASGSAGHSSRRDKLPFRIRPDARQSPPEGAKSFEASRTPLEAVAAHVLTEHEQKYGIARRSRLVGYL